MIFKAAMLDKIRRIGYFWVFSNGFAIPKQHDFKKSPCLKTTLKVVQRFLKDRLWTSPAQSRKEPRTIAG